MNNLKRDLSYKRDKIIWQYIAGKLKESFPEKVEDIEKSENIIQAELRELYYHPRYGMLLDAICDKYFHPHLVSRDKIDEYKKGGCYCGGKIVLA